MALGTGVAASLLHLGSNTTSVRSKLYTTRLFPDRNPWTDGTYAEALQGWCETRRNAGGIGFWDDGLSDGLGAFV